MLDGANARNAPAIGSALGWCRIIDYNRVNDEKRTVDNVGAETESMSGGDMNTAGSAARESGFNGLRVIAFESRMAAETRSLIERYGGRATVAPSMREVPLEDNHAALDWAARVLKGEF